MKLYMQLIVNIMLLSGVAMSDNAVVTELAQPPRLNLGKGPMSEKPKIHRIRTAAALAKLGGDQGGLDFDNHDLVVVQGSLGCAHGKVRCETVEDMATFTVHITERCAHRTRQLHHFPYSDAYVVSKGTRIAPFVVVKQPIVKWSEGNLQEKLAKTEATHLNLTGYGVTDEDMMRLEDFQNLTHLYLSGNKITNKGLAHLAHLTQVYQLYLDHNPGVTDDGLKHLSTIMSSRIQILGIQGTSISRKGLEQLQKWSKEQKNQFSTEIHHSLVTPDIYE